jgi:hypothetical protein
MAPEDVLNDHPPQGQFKNSLTTFAEGSKAVLPDNGALLVSLLRKQESRTSENFILPGFPLARE